MDREKYINIIDEIHKEYIMESLWKALDIGKNV